jgi:hypothetical protein
MYQPQLEKLGTVRYFLACIIIIIGTPIMELTSYYLRLLNWVMPDDWLDHEEENQMEVTIEDLPEEVIDMFRHILDEHDKDDDDKDE